MAYNKPTPAPQFPHNNHSQQVVVTIGCVSHGTYTKPRLELKYESTVTELEVTHLETEVVRINRQGLLHYHRFCAIDVPLRNVANGRRGHLVDGSLVVVLFCFESSESIKL